MRPALQPLDILGASSPRHVVQYDDLVAEVEIVPGEVDPGETGPSRDQYLFHVCSCLSGHSGQAGRTAAAPIFFVKILADLPTSLNWKAKKIEFMRSMSQAT